MAALTINVSTVNPLGDRVFVKVSESEEKTAGGILLPDTAKEKPQIGEIAAVGPGKLNDKGERTPLEVKVGDKVLYSKYAGYRHQAQRFRLCAALREGYPRFRGLVLGFRVQSSGFSVLIQQAVCGVWNCGS